MSVIKSALPETGRGEKAERRERISVLAGGKALTELPGYFLLAGGSEQQTPRRALYLGTEVQTSSRTAYD